MAAVIFLAICAVSVASFAALHPFGHARRLEVGVLVLVSALLGAAAWLSMLFGLRGELSTAVVAACPVPIIALIILARRRRLFWHVSAVLDPWTRESGLSGLRAYLARKRPLERSQDARRAASVLAQKGLYDEAVLVLADVPISSLPPRWALERAVHGNDLAAYRTRLGDLAGARAALASIVERPGSVVGILEAKEALLSALEGDADEALAILAQCRLPARSPHLVTVELARAHAHAGLGDVDAARQALRALAARDPKWLERASKPSGPATPIAVTLAASPATPYR